MYIAHVAVLGKTSERGLELLNSALDSAGFMVVAVCAYDECDGVCHYLFSLECVSYQFVCFGAY